MDEQERILEKWRPGGCIKYGTNVSPRDRFSCQLEWAEYQGELLCELVFGSKGKPRYRRYSRDARRRKP